MEAIQPREHFLEEGLRTGHEQDNVELVKGYHAEGPRAGDEQLTGDDGVDITLIRWMLSLSPTERLHVLQRNVRSLARLCNESSFA